MTEKKARKNNNNLIIGISIGVVALIVVVVLIIVFAMRGNKLDSSFFVSDGSKYVATVNGDEFGFSEEFDGAPAKVHIVYFYSGDNITDVKSYYEFVDEATAKKAFDEIGQEELEDAGDYELNGKYIVLTAEPYQYEGMTAADAKEQVEFIEMSNNMVEDSESAEE